MSDESGLGRKAQGDQVTLLHNGIPTRKLTDDALPMIKSTVVVLASFRSAS